MGNKNQLSTTADGANETNGLGFVGLTTLVVTTCVGAGIFSLAGDLAQGGANTAAILISWAICFVGVFALAKTFSGLANVRPELAGGIYMFAREGVGQYVGFAAAWGYWISACLNNAGYGIMLFNALSYFAPVFGSGNSPLAIACASAFLWLLVLLLSRGIRLATGVNVVITLAKLVPLVLFICCVVVLSQFNPNTFIDNFWGEPEGMSLLEQIKSTMISLVWLFVGLEGAVVVSGRARDVRDVSHATTVGFLLVVVFYVLISVLSLGVLTRAELAQLSTPSLAGVFERVIGPVGAAIINGGVVVSLVGTMLGYLTFAAETSYQAAERDIFPSIFARTNAKGTAVLATLISASVTQVFLVLSVFAESTYQFFYTCSVYAILIPYCCAALYYVLIAWKNEHMDGPLAPSLISARIAGSIALLYIAFLIWSSGIKALIVMAIVIAPGTIIYIAKCCKNECKFLLTFGDKIFAALVVVAIFATVVSSLS